MALSPTLRPAPISGTLHVSAAKMEEDTVIRPRENGTWQVRVYAGLESGRKRYIHRTVKSYADAKKIERDLAGEVADGRTASAEKITVAELCDRWLKHAGPDLSPTTLVNYRGYVDNHIVPNIGTVTLAKLTTARLDQLYSDLRAKLSPQSIRHVHAIVRHALKVATTWGYLTRNVASQATPPKVPKSQHQPPDPETLRTFLAGLDLDLGMYVRLAAVTGCRRGEICGLRWSDIDLEHGTVHVARALIVAGGVVSIKGTKSDKPRPISLDPRTVELLGEHLEREQAKAKAYRLRWKRDAPVFTTDPGEAWNPDLASHRFRRAAKKAGLDAHLHDLRHWAITHGLASGHSVRQIADRAGHADGTLVLNRYGHAIPSADAAIATSLGALLDAT